MSPLPSIDIVICTYNHAPMLDRTLEALARQEIPPGLRWRTLVVDNNSEDETPQVVRRHIQAGRLPGLKRVREPRQGLQHARLCGIQHSSAPWVAFVDDDCLLEPGWVAAAARFAAQHPSCGAFGGQVVLRWETPPPDFVRSFGYSFAEQQHGPDPREVDFVAGAGLVVRRAALESCGYTHRQFLPDRTGESLVSGGDVEMALRLRGAGFSLWYTPACVLHHVIPPRRSTMRYLQAINYSLGICQLLGDALLWPGTYSSYLLQQAKTALHTSVSLLRAALRAAVRRRPMEETRIRWSFQRGKWAGIRQMLQMDARTRQALVGCALRPSSFRSNHA